jgi:ABC-type transport system involved in multi-copper enzyme maturation permease subunit
MKINLSANPVLVKELRGRMRGPRAYLFLTGTLALLGVVTYGLYRLARLSTQYMGGGPPGAVIGQGVFTGLVFLTLLIICAIAPSFTAGAISGEHEHKTFDMLMATPLRPASVLFGKLVASLSYVALLVLAAVPLASLSYVFGGVATEDMLQALLLLLGYALTFSVIGLFFSALFRRTGRATVASYITLAAFVVGTVFVYIVVGAVRQQTPPTWLLALNPFSAMASALAGPVSPGSFGGGVSSLLFALAGNGFDLGQSVPLPLWRYTVGIYAWLTVALYFVSTQLVKPVRRFRLSARGWAGVAAFIIVSALAVPVAYGPLTPGRIVAWMRWNASPRRDLVANGKFTAELVPDWSVGTEAEHDYESGGEVKLATDGERQVAGFSRTGSGHAETRITQVVSQSVPSGGWLQLRVVLRVQNQDVPMCGVQGSECPVMIKLVFEDSGGGKHEWMQGFYTPEGQGNYGAPPFCNTCESRQLHIRIPTGKWYTFESSNLLQDWVAQGYPLPRTIHSITVSAAGHSYESQVVEVSLLVREGRPPDWSSGLMGMGTPTPPPPPMFGGPIMIQQGIAVPVPPLVPPPTAAPPPTPPQTATPFDMPTFTPMPTSTASATAAP